MSTRARMSTTWRARATKRPGSATKNNIETGASQSCEIAERVMLDAPPSCCTRGICPAPRGWCACCVKTQAEGFRDASFYFRYRGRVCAVARVWVWDRSVRRDRDHADDVEGQSVCRREGSAGHVLRS